MEWPPGIPTNGPKKKWVFLGLFLYVDSGKVPPCRVHDEWPQSQNDESFGENI